jgi:xanthine dehydrogenase accessory factor
MPGEAANMKTMDGLVIIVKGGGDLATGVSWRLHQCGFRVLVTEIAQPLAVRRKVSFSEAVYDGAIVVEGVQAFLIHSPEEAEGIWEQNHVPVLVDPSCRCRNEIKPAVLIDATLAKKNLETSINDAPLVIALGPGFEAGIDAHFVVETNRGHRLGRLIMAGIAEPDTGVPGTVLGHASERVIRACADGLWKSQMDIGDMVRKGDPVGAVDGKPTRASIDGIIRGLIHPGIKVREGLKIGDIDPRPQRENCFTISEKALAIAGGVLEGILRTYGCSGST